MMSVFRVSDWGECGRCGWKAALYVLASSLREAIQYHKRSGAICWGCMCELLWKEPIENSKGA